MRVADLDDLTVSEIMSRWPETISIFIEHHLYCIGCPIAGFHTLADAADQHGHDLTVLTDAVAGKIGQRWP